MTDGNRTIQVTDEEFEHIIKLRQELERRRAAGKGLEGLPGGRRGAEFAMGAAAGIAAYWLYNELMEEDAEEAEAEEEETKPVEVRPVAVVKSDPRKRRGKGR